MGEVGSLLRDSDVYEGYWLQTWFFFFYKQNFGSLRLNILVLEEYAYAY